MKIVAFSVGQPAGLIEVPIGPRAVKVELGLVDGRSIVEVRGEIVIG